jgi:hypothetical protein
MRVNVLQRNRQWNMWTELNYTNCRLDWMGLLWQYGKMLRFSANDNDISDLWSTPGYVTRCCNLITLRECSAHWLRCVTEFYSKASWLLKKGGGGDFSVIPNKDMNFINTWQPYEHQSWACIHSQSALCSQCLHNNTLILSMAGAQNGVSVDKWKWLWSRFCAAVLDTFWEIRCNSTGSYQD